MASEGICFTDNHTIFLTDLGPVTKEQIDHALVDYFCICEKHYQKSRDFWGKWIINIATNREGKSIGVAYVFFGKSEAYNIILGRDLNGERRFEEMPNPSYKEEESKDDEDSGYDISWNISSSMSWGDLMDEPREPKTIKIPINEPEVLFPPIKLTPVQKEKIGISEINPQIKACIAYNPDPSFNKYTLFAKNIPSWVSENEIQSLFIPFVTDFSDKKEGFPKVTLVKQTHQKGNQKRDFFNKSNSGNLGADWRSQHQKGGDNFRMAFIKFNSRSNDSMFALMMSKKATIRGKGRYSEKRAELFFSYAKDQGPR